MRSCCCSKTSGRLLLSFIILVFYSDFNNGEDIFVGNVPQKADEEEFRTLFSEYGTITECTIIQNFVLCKSKVKTEA